ncbi:MAG TPA: DUF5985 family protein [Terriglobales bacterium]|jgi:hypothetical protein
MIEAFLLGVIATASLTAGMFFLKFWKKTHDTVFLAFVVYFLTEGGIRVAHLFFAHPNEASPWIYVIRLMALMIILAAVFRKNYG